MLVKTSIIPAYRNFSIYFLLMRSVLVSKQGELESSGSISVLYAIHKAHFTTVQPVSDPA